MMTIRQTGSKGDFVDTLLQVVAYDDIVALLAYSIAISVAVKMCIRDRGMTEQMGVPVKPIIPTATDPNGKLKEITDRLEQGIADLFGSERFKEYLNVMSKFHN